MKRLAIIYGTDPEYIQEVVSFFQLRELQKGGRRRYLAVSWADGTLDRKVLSVNRRLEIEEEITDAPPEFEEAVVLSLPAFGEQRLHREISAYLQSRHIPLLNPYPTSRLADNKYLAISRLAAKKIPVPESLLLRKPDASKLIPKLSAFLDRHRASGFYVQPNEGTEGRETYFLTSGEVRRSPEYVTDIVSGLLRDREAIVKKARGNVFYFHEAEKERGYRPVTFRVLVWRPGQKIERDLGFAEVSASEHDGITSLEKGGRIIALREALANLFYRDTDGFRRVVLTEEERRRLPAVAVRALAAFNSGRRAKLRIAGVDLLLEVTRGRVLPVILEINPRPSGLDKLAPFVRPGRLDKPRLI